MTEVRNKDIIAAGHEISLAYARGIEAARKLPPIERSRPLNELGIMERKLRGIFLDNERLARKKYEALRKYIEEHGNILTEEAYILFTRITMLGYTQMHPTRIIVPETGDILDHQTKISLVSFYNERETRRRFDCLRDPHIGPLNIAETKQNNAGKYWSTSSQTEIRKGRKTETTILKIRGRKFLSKQTQP